MIEVKAGHTREAPPVGSHKGVIADIVDRGWSKSDFTGKDQHKVALVIQLEETNSEARRFETWSFLTVSADPKSNMYKLIKELFDEYPVAPFNVTADPDLDDTGDVGKVYNFYNVPVLVNIGLHESGDAGKWTTKVQRYPANLLGEPITVSDDFVPVQERKRDDGVPF